MPVARGIVGHADDRQRRNKRDYDDEPDQERLAEARHHFLRRVGPLGIAVLQDVAARGARFINRQRGSGTRLALEHMLQEQGIDRAGIKGYYTEKFTHLAAAAAIASGIADAGIGIEAAARRLKLDFIPLFVEDYYVLGKRKTVERADVEMIVALLKSDHFACSC